MKSDLFLYPFLVKYVELVFFFLISEVVMATFLVCGMTAAAASCIQRIFKSRVQTILRFQAKLEMTLRVLVSAGPLNNDLESILASEVAEANLLPYRML